MSNFRNYGRKRKAYYSRTASEGCTYWSSYAANESYNKGEKPLSKWKKEIGIVDFPILMRCLRGTGWHHTGTYAMKTEFYEPVSNKILLLNYPDFFLKISKNKKKFWSWYFDQIKNESLLPLKIN